MRDQRRHCYMTLLQSFPWSEERLEHFLNAALYGHMPWSPSDADEELPVMSPVSALTKDLQRGQRQLAEASESEDLSDPDVPLSPEKIATPVRVSDSWTFGELSSLRLMSSEFDRSPQKLEVADGIVPFASAASSCSAKSTAREAADRTAQFSILFSSILFMLSSAKSSAMPLPKKRKCHQRNERTWRRPQPQRTMWKRRMQTREGETVCSCRAVHLVAAISTGARCVRI